jgi:hypothetical protein
MYEILLKNIIFQNSNFGQNFPIFHITEVTLLKNDALKSIEERGTPPDK